MQEKTLSHSGDCVLGEGQMNTFSLMVKSLGIFSIARARYQTRGLILDSLWHFITKCDSSFITKCGKSLLQNASGFLLQNATGSLQNATVITNCYYFITKCDSYYKMRRLLQIASVQTSLNKLEIHLIPNFYLSEMIGKVVIK